MARKAIGYSKIIAKVFIDNLSNKTKKTTTNIAKTLYFCYKMWYPIYVFLPGTSVFMPQPHKHNGNDVLFNMSGLDGS